MYKVAGLWKRYRIFTNDPTSHEVVILFIVQCPLDFSKSHDIKEVSYHQPLSSLISLSLNLLLLIEELSHHYLVEYGI